MFIDLTLSVDLDDPVLQKTKRDPKNWFMSQGHIGTHLDVVPGQSPPPAEFCSRRGVLIAVAGTKMKEIDLEVLEGTKVGNGDFVIFYTGHLNAFPYGSPDYFGQQPRMSWALVTRLAESNISFVGLDFPGMRPGKEHGLADMRCGEHGKYVIENLNNVDQLHAVAGARPFQVYTGWTGFKGATGLSCRVTAMVA